MNDATNPAAGTGFVYLVMTTYPDWSDDYPFERIAGVYLSEDAAVAAAKQCTVSAQESRDAFAVWKKCSETQVPPLRDMDSMKWQTEVRNKCGEPPAHDDAPAYRVVPVPVGVLGSWN